METFEITVEERAELNCLLDKARQEVNARHIKGRRGRLIRLKELKGGKCIICGYDKNYAALDFHHREPNNKSFCVNTQGIDTHGFEACVVEIAKCDLLCRNCHSEIHYPETRKKQHGED